MEEKISRWSSLPSDRTFTRDGLGGRKWEGQLLFAQLADTQLGLLHNNKSWEEELESMKTAMHLLNFIKPTFAIVCGDLVNHVPEIYPKQDPNIRKIQVKAFKQCIEEELSEDIPLVCVCGNHDVGDHPTPLSIDRYIGEFGDDYYVFWAGGVCGVVLNSGLYYDPSNAEEHFQKQHEWLENTLKEISLFFKDSTNGEEEEEEEEGTHHPPTSARIIVFTHHPLFLNDAEEDDDEGSTSFSLHGRPITMSNKYFRLPKERRKILLHTLATYGVQWVFSGHWHRCHTATAHVQLHPHEVEEKYVINQVITGAVGTPLGPEGSGFRLVHVHPTHHPGLIHQYFEFGKDVKTALSEFLDHNIIGKR